MLGELTARIMELMEARGPAMVFAGVITESVIVPLPSPLIIMGAGATIIAPGLSASAAFLPIAVRIVLPGAAASTLGAGFAYGLGYWGGRPFVDRWERFLGFGWEDVARMEKRLERSFGPMIFLLRALPIVPLSLISAAAGTLRLPAAPFGAWTFLGSLPRCLLLGYLGYMMRGGYEGLAGALNTVETLVSAAIVGGSFLLILVLRARLRRA